MLRTATLRLAHKSASFASFGGNGELRELQDLIDTSKAVVQSLQKLSADYARAMEVLEKWGSTSCQSISSSLHEARSHFTGFVSTLGIVSSQENMIRTSMKALRAQEESVLSMHRRQYELQNQAAGVVRKISRMTPSHPNLNVQQAMLAAFNQEIDKLAAEIPAAVPRLALMRTNSVKEWTRVRFLALAELAQVAQAASANILRLPDLILSGDHMQTSMISPIFPSASLSMFPPSPTWSDSSSIDPSNVGAACCSPPAFLTRSQTLPTPRQLSQLSTFPNLSDQQPDADSIISSVQPHLLSFQEASHAQLRRSASVPATQPYGSLLPASGSLPPVPPLPFKPENRVSKELPPTPPQVQSSNLNPSDQIPTTSRHEQLLDSLSTAHPTRDESNPPLSYPLAFPRPRKSSLTIAPPSTIRPDTPTTPTSSSTDPTSAYDGMEALTPRAMVYHMEPIGRNTPAISFNTGLPLADRRTPTPDSFRVPSYIETPSSSTISSREPSPLPRDQEFPHPPPLPTPRALASMRFSEYTYGTRLSHISEVSTTTTVSFYPDPDPVYEAWPTYPNDHAAVQERGAIYGPSYVAVPESMARPLSLYSVDTMSPGEEMSTEFRAVHVGDTTRALLVPAPRQGLPTV